MNLISLFTRRRSDATQTQRPTRPRGVAHDPHLVDKLKGDHRQLLRLYARIQRIAAEGYHDQAGALLRDLKLAFQAHVMVENVRFYVYLQQQLQGDPHVTGFLDDIRREMDGIALALVKFVKKYGEQGAIKKDPKGFADGFEEIGRILTQRVATEESDLYTLYLPEH